MRARDALLFLTFFIIATMAVIVGLWALAAILYGAVGFWKGIVVAAVCIWVGLDILGDLNWRIKG